MFEFYICNDDFGKFFRLSEKKFKALEYERATYHLKAPDLKISNTYFYRIREEGGSVHLRTNDVT